MRASDPVAFRVESTTVETTVVTEECLDLLLLDGPLGPTDLLIRTPALLRQDLEHGDSSTHITRAKAQAPTG